MFTSGAFSPDGTRLAVFLNPTNPQDPYHEPISDLAIVNTRTGAFQLVRAARLGTFEDVGWAGWLPGGHWLIVGADEGSYDTLSAKAFSLGNDINFSATVLPASCASAHDGTAEEPREPHRCLPPKPCSA